MTLSEIDTAVLSLSERNRILLLDHLADLIGYPFDTQEAALEYGRNQTENDEEAFRIADGLIPQGSPSMAVLEAHRSKRDAGLAFYLAWRAAA